MNCPGDSFVPFTMNAARYALIYKPGSSEGPGGPAKIVRLAADGKGVTTTFSGYLGQRLTHLVPFTVVEVSPSGDTVTVRTARAS
jgi:hypothetical protein